MFYAHTKLIAGGVDGVIPDAAHSVPFGRLRKMANDLQHALSGRKYLKPPAASPIRHSTAGQASGNRLTEARGSACNRPGSRGTPGRNRRLRLILSAQNRLRGRDSGPLDSSTDIDDLGPPILEHD